ncbi:nascent polypeptide-associated complex subunit alpha, muscle-specific form-like [Amphibalanus amphitrite]|uniref:nascent polypeptide-associated complex subunit alpha, muscle-specific form-like n=1 Tax=Amphibalanus amphitrite TaxID=1232801 RepID=UPI001C91BF02|nr:nascent polypeptide-associated complex subunit alpha, muscle-specific form-like [Amphibalanus amphitrite]XP_043210938.1 nascent polypeptide-associated complex subunit alpha, muscle-specific form-like [Amphibalanus amphitrite]XP_043210939.1 nascent polypeptide-associated complex subunit alpha, muscle-specific form-like [Amphibalanus amphitrite]
MAELQLRQVWADLMPSFPDPAALLNISDPDDRAATMLIKTLYVLFQGVLQDRHQLRCEKQPNDCPSGRANGSVPPTVGSRHHTTPARPAGGAASAPPASAEEFGPSSPDDLVPPSPGDVTYFNQPKRRPVVLAPETVDVPCAPRGGPPTRPVPETAPPPPPPVVWVPETLESSPARRGHRPCPVAETVQLPATPPRPVRPTDPVSPVLTARTPATRRARRRAGATASPRQSQGAAPAVARGTHVATPQNERRAEVASPTPSLSSPLLLPQHPPGRARRPPTTEPTPAELPKRNGGKPAGSAVPATSVRPTAGKGHGEGDQPAASSGRTQSQGACQTHSRSPNKRKRLIIGPGEPVPPRKRKQSVSPQKKAPQERTAAGCSSGSNFRTGVSEQPASRTPTKAPAGAHTTVTSTKRAAPSIFELEIDSNKTGETSTSNKTKRTSPRRKATPPSLNEERRAGGAAPESAQTDETPLGLDVLMEELNRDKQGTNNGADVHAQQHGNDRAQAITEGGAEQSRTEREGAAVGRDGRSDGDEVMAPPAEPPEHDSQEETQMDSMILGDEQLVAGPARRYAASPVRRRADRQRLPGWSCAVCKEWYSDRNMTDEELRAHMNRCSRHRQQEPPPPDTPPEFWDPVAFPATDITQYGAVTPRPRPRRRL